MRPAAPRSPLEPRFLGAATAAVAAAVIAVCAAAPRSANAQLATAPTRAAVAVRILEAGRSIGRPGVRILRVTSGRPRIRVSHVLDWCARQTTIGASRAGSRIDLYTGSSPSSPGGDARMCTRDLTIELGSLPPGVYVVVATLDGIPTASEPRRVSTRLVVAPP